MEMEFLFLSLEPSKDLTNLTMGNQSWGYCIEIALKLPTICMDCLKMVSGQKCDQKKSKAWLFHDL